MDYYIRKVVHKDGKVEEVRVPKKEVDRKIKAQLKEDREMLKILKKL